MNADVVLLDSGIKKMYGKNILSPGLGSYCAAPISIYEEQGATHWAFDRLVRRWKASSTIQSFNVLLHKKDKVYA
ncbi:hypothetical protein C9J03_20335 [Photobacterium gaetbulicola]|nr:hypothetical protein C9J03_20335 [Photobacterium gaetbulicola]